MKVIAISTDLKGKNLEDALVDFDAVVADAAYSMEELKLADHLSKRSFEQKRNIAKKKKYEFLLWLTGKTDLKSAFRNALPKSDKMILIVFSGDGKEVIEKIEAKTQDWKLKTQCVDPLSLERISLSRVRN